MLNDLKVKVGPEFYQYTEGAIDFVPKILDEFDAKNVLIVHGTISWEKAKPYLTFLENEKYNFTFHKYTGECSYYGTELICDIIKKDKIDFIVGVGGGKLCDLVGFSAHKANVQFGVIPTLPSNCAPWTPLSIMYKETGESEGKSEHFLRQAAFFLTDPRLVIDSPVRFFIAGIADTLAKWYESDLILQQEHLVSEPFLRLARYTALISKDVLMKDGSKAIKDMENKELSEEFTRVSEIIFAVAGLVGGLGDKYARNAAAHAMHDAIAKYLPKSHEYLHGEKVAYGIFFQLALEDKWEVIDELQQFYKQFSLPCSLTEMGLYPLEENDMKNIVTFINSKDKVHLIPIEINEEFIKNRIINLEKHITNK
ncbi:iron-containing alcohol dehydrogenase family protein [Anaerorhabdus sp.]|jgi:hydroxycarboxylate dehydrogenase A|uniref:iron-containing alcohol dehydrogenase family protein n=1 Tax=Anaerorhabdus sp. TaxID=1872524 RepID=UPI002FCC7D94